MANIIVSDLITTRFKQNSESFLHELNDTDCQLIWGGLNHEYSEFINLNIKILESSLIAFAISNITSLVKLFINSSSDSI